MQPYWIKSNTWIRSVADVSLASLSSFPAGPKAIVIDSGSFLTRAGFAGQHGPQICFRSIVGREGGDLSFGEDALFSDAATDVACPIDGETVTNWDDLEKVSTHVCVCV